MGRLGQLCNLLLSAESVDDDKISGYYPKAGFVWIRIIYESLLKCQLMAIRQHAMVLIFT